MKYLVIIMLFMIGLFISTKPAYAIFNPCIAFPWLPQCHQEPTPTPTVTPTPTISEQEPTPTATEEATPTPTGVANVEPYQGENTTVTCDTGVANHEQYCSSNAPQPLVDAPRTLSSGPTGSELPNTGSNDLLYLLGSMLALPVGAGLIWKARSALTN